MACLDAPLLGDVDIINTYSPFDAEEIDWLSNSNDLQPINGGN
jgi:hypothetical protein